MSTGGLALEPRPLGDPGDLPHHPGDERRNEKGVFTKNQSLPRCLRTHWVVLENPLPSLGFNMGLVIEPPGLSSSEGPIYSTRAHLASVPCQGLGERAGSKTDRQKRSLSFGNLHLGLG